MKTLLSIGVLVLLCVVGIQHVEAIDRYVDACTNGITTYNPATRACTGGSAIVYSTIPNGLRALRTTSGVGDTLWIRGGTYTLTATYGNTSQNDTWGCQVGGCPTSWANATMIKNYPSETVIINQTNGYINFDGDLARGGVGYVIWEGDDRSRFILDGQNNEFVPGMRIVDLAHHVRLMRMTIRNTGSHGIQTGTTASQSAGCSTSRVSFIEILDNTISGHGTANVIPQEHGMYPGCGDDITVRGNSFIGNAAFGIHFFGNTSPNSYRRIVIDRNYIEGRKSTTITTGCIMLNQSADSIITNNVCVGKGTQSGTKHSHGISAGNNNTNLLIANNTFYDTAATGLQFFSGTYTLRNNLFNLTPDTIAVESGSATVTASHNLCPSNDTTVSGACAVVTTTPGFVNAAGLDFHLTSTSPARDQGANLSPTVTTDKDGNLRIVPYDIGAYEFGGSPDTTPPSVPTGVFVSQLER